MLEVNTHKPFEYTMYTLCIYVYTHWTYYVCVHLCDTLYVQCITNMRVNIAEIMCIKCSMHAHVHKQCILFPQIMYIHSVYSFDIRNIHIHICVYRYPKVNIHIL